MDEIGQKLRNARIKKGYTIDDLQQVTKIQKRYLIAIEEGQFDHLPGDFYVRAFIKQYCEAVDLDSNELLDEYKAEIPDSQPHEEVTQEDTTKKRAISESSNSFLSGLRNYVPQIIVGIVVIIIIGVIIFGMVNRSKSSSQVTIPKDTSSQTTSKSKSKSSSSTKKKSTAKKATTNEVSIKESATQGTYTIKNLPANKDTDVVVSADGGQAWISFTEGTSNMVWQQAISSGDKKSTSVPADTKTFSIHTGNIQYTKITVAGKSVDLGTTSNSSSIVRTLTFNIE
ncbi:helix-turn-helix domain-containing protein [Companilactobacillus sp.]|jgi:cytoskeletal protein RodZ|uniref:helix-turn-helix domain-containing protein n=1 Tax=Companilactobacillus sp. TaxID=2767905 RepID=UPI0025BB8C6C|nr:RodZ domain-containing protein [Companilactobacillus sp.]MCH4008813.1 helix-turn-helix domain-containing protein [Companilactobacillus sp.]MCH4051008.1 helix-turn-helix domain-containing protein [Companilactobacillus sp.]MCH4076756.1 helix-turn-helix domain-containing protein [Companilactobacillus sp.]MCH4125331.1 helix-turn-helix domain-containing protein [Companilactobacillus sp.]MCH4131871.1 helix-turn-helix domain-containing protein [Companilactobacillus sp.]